MHVERKCREESFMWRISEGVGGGVSLTPHDCGLTCCVGSLEMG